MKKQSYTREIVVSADPSMAYRALTQEIDRWWAPQSDVISSVGDQVSFRFPPTTWTMQVSRLIPGRLIELECIEANHIYEGAPDTIREEWIGTTLIWELEEVEEQTRIGFVHQGLVPKLDCYEICEAGWDHYFVNELQQYLNKKESAASIELTGANAT